VKQLRYVVIYLDIKSSRQIRTSFFEIMAGDVPWGEAFAAMMAMMIVLVFVLIYYCVMPIYHGMRRRKLMREEAWEHDPRWAGDQFKFTPKRPDNFLTDKKYSRLAACSRSSR
jgi:cytochrome b subunit of formate dehydrogenase